MEKLFHSLPDDGVFFFRKKRKINKFMCKYLETLKKIIFSHPHIIKIIKSTDCFIVCTFNNNRDRRLHKNFLISIAIAIALLTSIIREKMYQLIKKEKRNDAHKSCNRKNIPSHFLSFS